MQKSHVIKRNHKSKEKDQPICIRCKAVCIDTLSAYTCLNGHYTCYVCYQFLFKAKKHLICVKCNHEIGKANILRKSVGSRQTNRTFIIPCYKCKMFDFNNVLPKVENNKMAINAENDNVEILKLKPVQESETQTIITGVESSEKKDESVEKIEMDSVQRSEISVVETDDCDNEKDNGSDIEVPRQSFCFTYNSYKPYVIPTRPVICPITNCNKVVAATGFIPHFEFEHRSISFMEVFPKEQYTLIVNPNQVMDDCVSCVCLFTLETYGKAKYVSGLDRTPSCEDREQNRIITVPYTMMIARLIVKFSDDDSEDDMSVNSYMHSRNDMSFLIVWVCGFDSSPEVYYSLEATYNTYRTRACIYSGPIISLRETQNPRDLLRRGECLLISPGLTKTLCQDTGCIDINLTFH